MQHSPSWLISLAALGLAAFLALWLVRLRLELWANRRALAILEKSQHKPAKDSRFRLPEWALLGLFLLVLWQLLK